MSAVVNPVAENNSGSAIDADRDDVDGGDRYVGVVAIDGPSGSGKSTVSRRLATRLGVPYLDTGAMYRAATWAVLRAGVDLADADAVAAAVASCELKVGTDPASPTISVNDVNVSGPIRGAEVTAAVSAVAAVPAVRRQLVAAQQAIIAAALDTWQVVDRPRGIIVEGRDIAKVVAPSAELKVYVTASEEVRALRRSGETPSPEPTSEAQVAAVQADLRRRDELDSARAVDPLQVADDAVVLDTTSMSIDDVVARLVELHAAAV